MDEKSRKIGLTKYWFSLVFSRARHEIWEYTKGHLAIALLITLVAVVTSSLSANGILDAAISDGYISDANNLIRTLVAVLILSIFYLLFSVFYYPVIIYREQEEEKKQLQEKIKRSQKSQDKKEVLKNYDDIEISYTELELTLDERRQERGAPGPMAERRLPYLVKNVGGYSVRECRIRMTYLAWLDGHNDGNEAGNARLEDISIKWKNFDTERINLGNNSSEVFVLARIPDLNAIPIFHFVTFGDENKSIGEKYMRLMYGTWQVGIQIEGQIQSNNHTIDIIPIPYTISFEFDKHSLIPLEVVKHEGRAKKNKETSRKKSLP